MTHYELSSYTFFVTNYSIQTYQEIQCLPYAGFSLNRLSVNSSGQFIPSLKAGSFNVGGANGPDWRNLLKEIFLILFCVPLNIKGSKNICLSKGFLLFRVIVTVSIR